MHCRLRGRRCRQAVRQPNLWNEHEYSLEDAARQFPGGNDRLIDDHRARIGAGFQPVQRAEQQRLRFRVGQRFAQQAAANELPATLAAPHAVSDILRRGACRGRFAGEQQQGLGEALAGMHPGQHLGGEHPGKAEQRQRQRQNITLGAG